MRDQFDFAAFDPHPAFRLHRGFRDTRHRLRLRLPLEPGRELRGHDDANALNNPERR